MALPDVTKLVLDRLALNMAEVGNGLKVVRYEPLTSNIPNDWLPLCFFSVGATTGPLNTDTNNIAIIERVYTISVFVKPIEEEKFSTTLGSTIFNEVEPWIGRIENYFLQHQDLHTASLGGLAANDAGVWSLRLWKPITIGPNEGVFFTESYAGTAIRITVPARLSFKQA